MHGGIASVPGGRLIALDEKLWDTPTIIRVAGVEQATLLQWRRKYGFLGGPRPGAGRIGYKHSVVDVCLICTVAEMIQHGVEPNDACRSPYIEAQIIGLISGELDSNLLGFHRGGTDPDIRLSFYQLHAGQTLGEVLPKTPAGLVTIIDLRRIIIRAFEALDLTVPAPKKSTIPAREPPNRVISDQDRTAKTIKPKTKPKKPRHRRAKLKQFQKQQGETLRRQARN